jgi:hypothetical protein
VRAVAATAPPNTSSIAPASLNFDQENRRRNNDLTHMHFWDLRFCRNRSRRRKKFTSMQKGDTPAYCRRAQKNTSPIQGVVTAQ